MDLTLVNITDLGQSEPQSDGNEGYITLLKAPGLESHYQMV